MPSLDDPHILRTVLEHLYIGVYLVDSQRRILFWNEGAERITGYLRHEVIGRVCHDNVLEHCDPAGTVLCQSMCPLSASMRDGRPAEAHVFLRHKQGHRVPVHVRVVPIRDAHGSVVGAAESFEEREVHTGQVRHNAHLAAHGCLDGLTGLPNRVFTRTHLEECLAQFVNHRLSFGALGIQVLNLHGVEHKFGRSARDMLLRTTAETLRHTLEPSDFLGRWSMDQFLAVLPDSSLAQLQGLALETQQVVSGSQIPWWGDPLSVEVDVYPSMVTTGDTVEQLLQRLHCSDDNDLGCTPHPWPGDVRVRET